MIKKIFILFLFLGFGATIIAQDQIAEDNTDSSLFYCFNFKKPSTKLDCYQNQVNKKIMSELNGNLSSLNISTKDTILVSYRIMITENGSNKLTELEIMNPTAAKIVESLLSNLEDVPPFENEEGERYTVSYESERRYYLNKKGELDDKESSKDVSLMGPADVPFATIENVPIYPGCNGDNNLELKYCMSKKVQEFVSRNFNMKLLETLNLPPKRYRIAVQFKIDREGNVVDVRSRADRDELELEAIRVVSSLPKMKPGIQRGKEVGVLYALPIIFEVEPPARDQRKAKRAKKKNKL